MPLDPVIAGGVRPVELPDPLQQYARISAIQNAQNQNALAQYQLSAAQRQNATQNALNAAWQGAVKGDGSIDYPTLYGALARGGAGSTIPGVQKQQVEATKAQADLEKTRAETLQKWAQSMGWAMQSAVDNPTDQSLLDRAQHMHTLGIPEQVWMPTLKTLMSTPDLAARKQLATQLIMSDPGAKAAWEAVQPKPEKIDLGGKIVVVDLNPNSRTFKQPMAEATKTMTPGEVASNEVARGNLAVAQGNLSVSQQRLKWEQANPGYSIHETPDGLVAVNNKNPNDTKPVMLGGEPVQGKSGLSEFQGKATGYAMRARQAEEILAGTNYSPSTLASKQSLQNLPVVGGVAGAAANLALPVNAQKVEQAQREFVNAVLRQDSGAAISESEWENAKKQYFAQPGDKPEVIKQKAENRAMAIRTLEISAGPGMKQAGKPGPTKGDPLGIR